MFFGRSRELRRKRREADAWIALGYENRAAVGYAWRIDELTSPRERKLLARSLRGIVRELRPGTLPGAVPLNRPAVRPHRALVSQLASRLDELERPVSGAGILAVQRLLTEPGSPFYAHEADVRGGLTAVLRRLDDGVPYFAAPPAGHSPMTRAAAGVRSPSMTVRRAG